MDCRRAIATIVLAFSLTALAQSAPLSTKAQTEVQNAVSTLLPPEREVKSLEIHPHPKIPNVFLVLWDDGFWFKSFRIIGVKDGVLLWTAASDPQSEWGDRTILSAEWKVLTNIGITALEVYTSSHRGNGEYLIFALKDQKLKGLLAARSIGNLEEQLPQGSLSVHIERRAKVISPQEGAFEQIELKGLAQYSAKDSTEIVKTETLRQVFQWNSSKKIFQEDVKLREGTPSFLFID